MSGPLESLTAAIWSWLREYPELEKEANDAGVSVGFLAGYVAQNFTETISREIVEAAKCGELSCPKCARSTGFYYNYKSHLLKSNDKGELICPLCDTPLQSVTCSNCGENTYSQLVPTKQGFQIIHSLHYHGHYVNGHVVCERCQRILEGK